MSLSIFKPIAVMVVLLAFGCDAPPSDPSIEELSFCVADVGQGAAQFLVSGNEAIMFDAGPAGTENRWKESYALLGKPFLRAIVISHRDLDHSGGLAEIDPSIAWSGTIVTSSREDTALLRSRCTRWNKPIRFETITQGDSLIFGTGAKVRCLWPPKAGAQEQVSVADDSTNFYSIVCLAGSGNSTVLITGDIDSTGARTIAAKYTVMLKSDLVVVPHHGSGGSVCPLFYGYVRPATAILSFGKDNTYGHPSASTLTMLAELGIRSVATAENGSMTWVGNGYYWTPRFQF